MKRKPSFLGLLRYSSLAGGVVVAAVLAGPTSAHKDPVTPAQLKAYQEAFMEQVRKGDLLFHGDQATADAMGVGDALSKTGMACAMCHPMASDTHPQSFPKFQAQMATFATLRDMINWCIEKPNQGVKIEPESEAMKALEAYITWSNTGSVLQPGKY
ncbi:c-type cytochrome [Rhizobium giardinii]|uniref:c-type cytochrome n=1 Tax=Rhizobium giardinii TaxID=56731 RepID=UPI000DD94B23